ncbi:MAG: hypothetical protein K2L21_09845 [Muribaculaceae bacterium]|nr:hypothetical protein [Muribaculaceae bacterium]
MKLFKYSVLALALAAGFASCSDEETYVAGAASDGVYFPTTDSVDVELDRKVPTFDVVVSRLGETQAATYGLTGSADDEVFTLPTSVSFAQGETSVTLKIPYNADNMGMDKAYKVILGFAEGTKISSYGYESLELSVVLPAPWTTVAKGTYQDGFLTYSLFDFGLDGKALNYECELQRNDIDTTRYRWVNPYGENFAKAVAAVDEELEDDQYDSKNNHYIEFYYFENPDKTQPGYAVIPLQPLGFSWNDSYGEFYVCNEAGYLAYSSDIPNADIPLYKNTFLANYPETLSTFDFKKFTTAKECALVMFGATQGFYYGNSNADIVNWYAEGVELKDYALDLQYSGVLTDSEGDMFAQVSVALGEDLKNAQIALVEGADEEGALEAVLAGEVSTTKLEESDKAFTFPIYKSGDYVVVAVGYNDEDEQVSSATLTFFAVTANEPKEWKSLGQGKMIDAWVIPAFNTQAGRADPMNYAMNVKMEENIENAGVYRVVKPWTSDSYPGASLNSNTTNKDYNLVIDARNPDMVSILPQCTGFHSAGTDSKGQSYSEVYWVTSFGDVMAAMGYNYNDIVDEGADNFVENGMIVIQIPTFGVTTKLSDAAPDIDDCGYSFYNTNPYSDEEQYCPSLFQLPGAGASAPAMVAMKRLESCVKAQMFNPVMHKVSKHLAKKAGGVKNAKTHLREYKKQNRVL